MKTSLALSGEFLWVLEKLIPQPLERLGKRLLATKVVWHEIANILRLGMRKNASNRSFSVHKV